MNKIMSKYLSRKIKFISVFAMIAVVFIHAYNYPQDYLSPVFTIEKGFNAAAMFEFFFSFGLFRFAIPLFFTISGFLFFLKYENTLKGYLTKIRKRAFSLMIPYVLWTLISGAAVIILYNYKQFKQLSFIKEHIVDWQHFYVYLIKPPSFQFWFIQQLLLFTVLAPLIYLLVKYTKAFILIPFGVLWACNINYVINSEGLFFFSVGAAFAIFGKARNVTRRDNKLPAALMCVLWLGLSTTLMLLAASKTELWWLLQTISKLNTAVGLVAIWLLFDHIVKLINNKKAMLLASAHLFFVFALHEPLLHISNQLALVPDSSDWSHFVLYICLPISVVSCCIILSMLTRKLLRPIHTLLTGGRNKRSGK